MNKKTTKKVTGKKMEGKRKMKMKMPKPNQAATKMKRAVSSFHLGFKKQLLISKAVKLASKTKMKTKMINQNQS